VIIKLENALVKITIREMIALIKNALKIALDMVYALKTVNVNAMIILLE
jgi:hypothetical protein